MIAQEEIFGPVLAIIAYDDGRRPCAHCERLEVWAGGFAMESGEGRALSAARRINSGTFGINHYMPDLTSPYGGTKASGMGRELGPEGLTHCQEVRWIYL